MSTPRTEIYLTEWFFVVFVLCQGVGVLALAWPLVLPIYLASWPMIIVAVAYDWLTTRTEVTRWSGSLSVERLPEIGEKTTVRFAVTGDRVYAWPRLILPAARTLCFGSATLTLAPVESEGVVTWRADVAARATALGFEEITALRILVASRLRFWRRAIRVPVPAKGFRVIPSRRQISPQAFRELATNQRLLYQGTRKMLRGRSPEQFYTSRKYQYPDPLRHIDAKKSAKFGQLMTRVYDAFYNHHLIIGLDVGRAMCGTLGGSSKHDYYLAACLLLAENAIRSQDRVSFFAFSQKVHHLVRGARTFHPFEPIFRGAQSLSTVEEESNFELALQTASRISGQRSIVLLFTDLSKPSVRESLGAVIPSLAARHLTVAVSLLDESYALESQILALPEKIDLEQYNHLLYSYWLGEELTRFKHETAARAGGVLMATQKDWLGVVVKLYGLMRQSMSI